MIMTVLSRLDDATNMIKAEQPFRTSVSGKATVPSFSATVGGADYLGNLPDEYHDDAIAARYVIYSYYTPVGWIRQDGTKVVPDIGYSLTTGQHQYRVLHAWGINRYPARGRKTVPSGIGRQWNEEN
jgi:hypothetical protein